MVGPSKWHSTCSLCEAARGVNIVTKWQARACSCEDWEARSLQEGEARAKRQRRIVQAHFRPSRSSAMSLAGKKALRAMSLAQGRARALSGSFGPGMYGCERTRGRNLSSRRTGQGASSARAGRKALPSFARTVVGRLCPVGRSQADRGTHAEHAANDRCGRCARKGR